MVKRDATNKDLMRAILLELKVLNRHMRVIARQIACHNAAEIPDILRRIDHNTTKPNLGG